MSALKAGKKTLLNFVSGTVALACASEGIAAALPNFRDNLYLTFDRIDQVTEYNTALVGVVGRVASVRVWQGNGSQFFDTLKHCPAAGGTPPPAPSPVPYYYWADFSSYCGLVGQRAQVLIQQVIYSVAIPAGSSPSYKLPHLYLNQTCKTAGELLIANQGKYRMIVGVGGLNPGASAGYPVLPLYSASASSWLSFVNGGSSYMTLGPPAVQDATAMGLFMGGQVAQWYSAPDSLGVMTNSLFTIVGMDTANGFWASCSSALSSSVPNLSGSF